MKFVLIYGSVREGRQGIKAALFVKSQLEERGHKVYFVDPLVQKFPLLERRYKEYDNPPKFMTEVAGEIKNCDGIVVVTGEYNHGIPPALKNILDHYLEEYFFKPSAIVSYSGGPFGGVRTAVHMRAVVGELGMPSIPSMFPISKVRDSFDEKGKDLTGNYGRRIKKFLDELEWYAEALKEARDKGTPY